MKSRILHVSTVALCVQLLVLASSLTARQTDRGAAPSVLAEDSFDSYSGTVTSYDGGIGWSAAAAGAGTSTAPGLPGYGRAVDDPEFLRFLDLSSPTLDPILVDSETDRVLGGNGTVIWTAFWLQTEDVANVGNFSAVVEFASGDFQTNFGNGFDNNQLSVNGGSGNDFSVAGSDLTQPTHVVARWVYQGDSTGRIEVWLNPTAKTESDLPAPDGMTPGEPGFIESFDRVRAPNFSSYWTLDNLRITTSYEAAVAPIFSDGFESGNTSVWASASRR